MFKISWDYNLRVLHIHSPEEHKKKPSPHLYKREPPQTKKKKKTNKQIAFIISSHSSNSKKQPLSYHPSDQHHSCHPTRTPLSYPVTHHEHSHHRQSQLLNHCEHAPAIAASSSSALVASLWSPLKQLTHGNCMRPTRSWEVLLHHVQLLHISTNIAPSLYSPVTTAPTSSLIQ